MQRHSRRVRTHIEALGQALRNRRTSLGMRQQDVAERAGCSATNVHVVEVGGRELKVGTLEDLAMAVGCTGWELLRDAMDVKNRAVTP